MGSGGRVSHSDMKSFYASRSIDRVSSANQIFTETSMHNLFDPSQMKLPREACDSATSPNSRGIIFAEDDTGSMSRFLLSLVKDEFPRLTNLIYNSVNFDPHIMFMGIGDVAAHDAAPLQVTQFEADIRILEQLEKIYLEEGGGGNHYESYILPWYFAGKFIKMDCVDKRGEKGFLFTFGDECPTPHLTDREIHSVFGKNDPHPVRLVTASDCLEMASEKFHCYHIILHGNYYSHYPERTVSEWRRLMKGHACDLSDHKYMPELVTTIIKMHEGLSKTEAIGLIQGERAQKVVRDALRYHEENVSTDSSAKKNDHPIDVF